MGALVRAVAVSVASIAASGCEPSPGDVVDTRTVSVGSLELALVLRDEGTFGNPANGQHLQLLCRRAGDWVQVARRYWVSGGLKRAPIERVVLDASGFFFSDINAGAVFSFNRCRDVSIWNGVLPPEFASVKLNDQLGEIDEVVFCPGGPQTAFRVSAEVFSGGARLWAQSTDAGRSWEVRTRISAPELCSAQKQIRVPAIVAPDTIFNK